MTQQKKYTLSKISLMATIISLLTFTIALAASGDLDPTFDDDGLVTNFVVPSDPGRNDIASGIVIQPADGKIIAVGYSYIPSTETQDFAAARYNVDGSLDTAFSGNGLLITNFKGRDTGFDVALQANGKIVVSGQVCAAPKTKGICDAAVARYNINGTLDTKFSGDGKLTTDFGGGDNGSFGGIAIQPNDGKILVGGYMFNGKDYDFAVYRYNANGTLDKTFSGDGKAKFGFGKGRQDVAEDIVLQSDGKILAVGQSCDSNGAKCDFALLRLNANGTLDKTFSGDGKQRTNMGADDYAWAVALQPNGRIVVAGGRYTSTLSYFAVARYTKNGSLDTTFNGTGKRVFSVIPGADSYASDILVQPDNKIVIAGSADNGGLFDFALVRLDSIGAFDTTFSDDGKLTIDFGGDDFGLTLGLQPSDGSYLLGGYTDDGTQRDFALTRVLP